MHVVRECSLPWIVFVKAHEAREKKVKSNKSKSAATHMESQSVPNA